MVFQTLLSAQEGPGSCEEREKLGVWGWVCRGRWRAGEGSQKYLWRNEIYVWQRVKQKAEDLGCGVGMWFGPPSVWPCQGQTGTGFRWVLFISVLKPDSFVV